MGQLNRKVAVCFMAHPDDCEFLAAGTLVHLARRDWEIHIVTVAAGNAGAVKLAPEKIAAIRQQEAMTAAKMIGASHHGLECSDLYIVYDEPTVRQSITLLRKLAPSLVLTHSLQDYMLDHEVTARLARTATFGAAVPNAVPEPFVPGSPVPYLYYADPTHGEDYYGKLVCPSTYVNITQVMNTKTKMLAAHISQREWLYHHHGMDDYIQSMQDLAAIRGQQMKCHFAEAFRQHRAQPYPRDCLLSSELGNLVTDVVARVC